MKRTALELAIGLALGFIAACVFGPRLISFWYKPPSQDAFSCAGSVEQALASFVMLELGTAAGGAVLVALGLWFIRRLLRKKQVA